VTDLEGRRIGWQAAIVRNLARLLDVLPFAYLLGGILTLVTRRHQRLGDLLAGTVVVPLAAVSYPPLPSGVRRRRVVGLAAVTAVLLVLCGTFAYFGRPPLVIEGAKNTSQGIFTDGVNSYAGFAALGNGHRHLSHHLRVGADDADLPRFHHAELELGFRRLGVQQRRVAMLAANLPLTLPERINDHQSVERHDNDEHQRRPDLRRSLAPQRPFALFAPRQDGGRDRANQADGDQYERENHNHRALAQGKQRRGTPRQDTGHTTDPVHRSRKLSSLAGLIDVPAG